MELGKEDPLCARCCSLWQALEQPSRIAASGMERSCGGIWWGLSWSSVPWKGSWHPGRDLGTLERSLAPCKPQRRTAAVKGPPDPSKPFHFCPQTPGLQCCKGRERKGLSSSPCPWVSWRNETGVSPQSHAQTGLCFQGCAPKPATLASCGRCGGIAPALCLGRKLCAALRRLLWAWFDALVTRSPAVARAG